MEIPEYILNYLLNSTWAIDMEYGIAYLSKLLFEINSGIKVDYSEVRAANLPIIINNAHVLEGSRYNLRSGNIPDGSIVKMQLNGVMNYNGGACDYGVKGLADDLYSAYNNPKISGIVIETNSGGGEVSAGNALMSAVADKNKPVLFHAHTMASAALKAALPANEIIAADPSSKVGAIGVFVSLNKKMIADYTENVTDVYSEGSPNKNREFRKLLVGDLSELQKMVNKTDSYFKADVVKYRNLRGNDQRVNDTLSGDLFFAPEAKSRGLIDGIGGMNYVLKRMDYHIKNQ